MIDEPTMADPLGAGCESLQGELAEAVTTRTGPRGNLAEHLESCARCSSELSRMQAVWLSLPETEAVGPPALVREAVLAAAHAAVNGCPVAAPEPKPTGVWGSWATPALGLAAAAGLVLVADVRGISVPLPSRALLPVSIVAAALALPILQRLGAFPTGLAPKTLMRGGLLALGGYALLLVALPIETTVHVCGDIVFGGFRLSLGRLCGVYLAVTSVYSGVPMAATSFLALGSPKPRAWMGGALVFALLATPTIFMQAGYAHVLVLITAMAGFFLGAFSGGFAGQRARRWVRRTA